MRELPINTIKDVPNIRMATKSDVFGFVVSSVFVLANAYTLIHTNRPKIMMAVIRDSKLNISQGMVAPNASILSKM